MSANDELKEAIDQIDMESWLEQEGVSFKLTRGSRGPQINVKECPHCGNSNWKVYIGQESGLGNCFVCETHFNKWKFIKESLGNLSVREVVEHVKQYAKEQGWRPPVSKSMAVNLKTDLIIPESFPLPINGRNLKYLQNRGITSEMAEYFALRFSKRGYFKYYAPDGKLVKQSYANRIIIPVFDMMGDLVTFQGRDITGEAERKYLFPPGFASTGQHLYNGHNAHGARHLVLGEGVFDVVATKIALDADVQLRSVVPVGTFGKSLTHGDDSSQLSKLMQLREHGLEVVTFMWDGEDKAIDAAIDTALLCRRHGLKARIALLPKDKDPNEVAPEVVRNAVWKAELVDTNVAARLKVARRVA